ncbi:MAG: hypothetical protein H0U69_05260 [Trueperaceae bacterium]|nr:hypothetical protein [Trueperaceae bacterium]
MSTPSDTPSDTPSETVPAAPLLVLAGNDLVQSALRVAYMARRDTFRGSGRRRGFSYAFDLTEAPIVRLVAGASDHDMELDLLLKITVSSLAFDVSRTLLLRSTAMLVVREGTLTVSGLRVTSPGVGTVDRIIAALVDARVVPSIEAALADVRIPPIEARFGGAFSLELASVSVFEGPAVAFGVTVVGVPPLAPAERPSQADVESLAGASESGAAAIAVASGDAVNAILAQLLPPLTHPFDRRRSRGRFGAGIKGRAHATTPALEVRDGRGTARSRVSFTAVEAGFAVPGAGWKWFALPVPTADVVVGHALSAAGRTALLTLSGVEEVDVRLKLPRALAPVEGVVRGLFARVMVSVRRRLTAAVAGREIELFVLPEVLPAGPASVGLRLEFVGLEYRGGSVRAAIRVRAHDAGVADQRAEREHRARQSRASVDRNS